jgi:hypothetical protein
LFELAAQVLAGGRIVGVIAEQDEVFRRVFEDTGEGAGVAVTERQVAQFAAQEVPLDAGDEREGAHLFLLRRDRPQRRNEERQHDEQWNATRAKGHGWPPREGHRSSDRAHHPAPLRGRQAEKFPSPFPLRRSFRRRRTIASRDQDSSLTA